MLKLIKNILLIFLGLVAAGYLALVCVYALPTSAIQQNVAEAANIIAMEESHPELIYGHQDTMLDNLTDSIMLGTARYEKTESVFKEALLVNRIAADDMMDSDVIAAEYTGDEMDGSPESYGRYWHGYLVYLKPLLMVLNYGQIRYLIGFVQFALLISVIYLMAKNKKDKHILPFIAAYMFLNPAALSLSLQYLPISVLTMVQMLAVLKCEEKYKESWERWIYHFFIIGALVSYFDFLTYPLLSLGIPMCYLLVENRKNLKEDILRFIGSCMAWGAGYASMWGSKWVLGTLITDENMIMDALGNVLLRVGAVETEATYSVLDVIRKNLGANKLCLLAVIIFSVAMLIRAAVRKQSVDFGNVNVSLILCAALPFAWYIVVSNHSYIHFWFTYRILAVSIYAELLLLTSITEKNKK